MTAVVLVLFLTAAACGKEGPPAPPLRMVPAPAQDLTLTQRGPQLLLELGYPKTTPGGTLLGGITGLEVWEVTRPAPGAGAPPPIDPRQFEAAATLVLKLDSTETAQATAGDRLLLRLPAPAAPAGAPAVHYYAVRTLGPAGDRSGISNQAVLPAQAAPPAPEELNVTPTGEGIEITWRPPSHPGAAVQGFNVYRREATARDYGRPLATLPATATRHLDTTARFGTSYIYAVTAIAGGAPLVESAVQAEREVRYLDRFPPPPPADLIALAESGRVRLVWRSSPAADLAGYVVFRRQGSGSWRRLTPDPIAALEFSDTAVAAGQTFTYRVTAVDQEGNESAAGPEAQATVP